MEIVPDPCSTPTLCTHKSRFADQGLNPVESARCQLDRANDSTLKQEGTFWVDTGGRRRSWFREETGSQGPPTSRLIGFPVPRVRRSRATDAYPRSATQPDDPGRRPGVPEIPLSYTTLEVNRRIVHAPDVGLKGFSPQRDRVETSTSLAGEGTDRKIEQKDDCDLGAMKTKNFVGH